MDNSTGFFDSLPFSSSKSKGRVSMGVRRLTKVEREQQRIQELEARMVEQRQRCREQVEKCQQRIHDQRM